MSDRTRLTELFQAMVTEARGLENLHFPDLPKGRLLILGAGKAAASMAQHVERHYAEVLSRIEGFVVVPYGHGEHVDRIRVFEASHPTPDDESLRRGSDMLSVAHSLGADDHLLMLMSGGASSLLVVPRGALSLQQKRAATAELLKSGLPIRLVNGVRKRLSAIKGGRLALAAASAPVTTLVVSDVPGDDSAEVGSGPTVPDALSTAQIREAIRTTGVVLGEALEQMLAASEAETPKPGDPRLPLLDCRVIMTAEKGLAAAERKARQWGFDVVNLGAAVEGEARDVARLHAEQAGRMLARGLPRPCVILSGGETSVTVRGSGRGGRNGEYLLALGLALRGVKFAALAADTDGIDGRGTNAGAYLDDVLLGQADGMGLDPERELSNNNALAVFEKLGSLVVTGPTRTNINDFRAILLSA